MNNTNTNDKLFNCNRMKKQPHKNMYFLSIDLETENISIWTQYLIFTSRFFFLLLSFVNVFILLCIHRNHIWFFSVFHLTLVVVTRYT